MLGERGFRIGSIFKRKDNGSEMVSGIICLRCIWRQRMVWVFVKDWPGCRGQVLYWPPESQPRRQRMQRLLSDLDIGSYRTGSREIVGRQCIRRTEACVERLLLRLSWRYSRCINCKERRSRDFGSGEHLFQMGDLESLYHCE